MSNTPRAAAAAIQPPPVVTIDPNGVYFPDDVRRLLRLKTSSIRSEKRAGRLRVARRCGRYYILGAWLLEWIAGGETPSRRPGPAVHSEASNRPNQGG